MNDLMLPSIVASPPRPKTTSNNDGPESPEMSASITLQSSTILDAPSFFSTMQSTKSVTDALALQQRFDTTRRKLHQLSLATKKERDTTNKANLAAEGRNLQLLSTMLYLTLMMSKIDEIKVLLKEASPATYVEYQLIFDSLRSPAFHLTRHQEGLRKAKKIYERKEKYKVMHDESAAQLKEYAAKVGKLQDLAVGTASEFGDALRMIKSGALGSGISEQTQGEINELRSKIKALEGAGEVLQKDKDGAIAAKSDMDLQMLKKDAEIERLKKEMETTKMLNKMDSLTGKDVANKARADAEVRADSADHRVRELEAKLSQSGSMSGAAQKEMEAQLAKKDKEMGELAYELEKAASLLNVSGGGGDGESSEKLMAVEADLQASQSALSEVQGILNHAQKRVLILEHSLEKEEEAKKKLEAKCGELKNEIEAHAGKLDELEEQGVEIGERPESPTKKARAKSNFPAETTFSEELQAERLAACKMLQGMLRKRQGYMRWFSMKLELTAKAGVMMALSGTPQGHTGFYLNPSSNMVYCWVVKESGEWKQLCQECHFNDYKKMEANLRRKKEAHKGESVIFPYMGTEDGRPGWYLSSSGGTLAYYEPGAHGVLLPAEEAAE